jgi:hypothetical protein
LIPSHVDSTEPEPVDLNVVRFSLRMQDETGATTRPPRLTVEVSYDQGASWQRAPVSPSLVAKLDHPAERYGSLVDSLPFVM